MIKIDSNLNLCADLWEIMDECYEPPNTYDVSKAVFAQQSYARWAVGEVIRYIEKRPEMEVCMLIEEFRNKMDDAACKAKTPEKNFMFSVAYDVATDVLDYVLEHHVEPFR